MPGSSSIHVKESCISSSLVRHYLRLQALGVEVQGVRSHNPCSHGAKNTKPRNTKAELNRVPVNPKDPEYPDRRM